MKIPKFIKIKGRDYHLIVVDGLIENEDAEGTCCDRKKRIRIDALLKNDDFKRTLLHEIGHSIMYETGLAQGLSEEIQEVITENFSNVIIDLFHIRFKEKK